MKKFKTLKEFYPYYLSEHQNTTCRVLHFVGTALVVLMLVGALLFHQWRLLLVLPFVGYGFAWIGHLFFEKNKPATFKQPIYSLAADFLLFWDICTGTQSFSSSNKKI